MSGSGARAEGSVGQAMACSLLDLSAGRVVIPPNLIRDSVQRMLLSGSPFGGSMLA